VNPRPARRSRSTRVSRLSDRGQQRGDLLPCRAHPRPGAKWFHDMGTEGSHGTKLFSVCGDCLNPGSTNCPTVIRSGSFWTWSAVGRCCGGAGRRAERDDDRPRQRSPALTFDDLATGGAIIVFNGERNILEIVEYYMSFFVHESCGYCTPCRVGNVFLQKAIAEVPQGLANPEDIDYLRISPARSSRPAAAALA
jgi:[NiFe] hydrogenase diaphorase moiety large subunit